MLLVFHASVSVPHTVAAENVSVTLTGESGALHIHIEVSVPIW